MHYLTRNLLATAAAFAMLGGVAAAQEAEVLHWWTSGGESAAVQEFATAYKNAGGTWVDTAIAGGENARSAGINRIIGGDPPTAMQFNTGKQFEDLVTQGLLTPLDDIAETERWKELLPPALLEAVSRDGKIYAVPVNVHGQNWLWYNKEAFGKAGAEPPETWEDFFAAAEKLRTAGMIPLAVGAQGWQLNLTFNALLLGQGGRDLFLKVYRDQDVNAIRSPEFKAVAETFGKLRDLDDQGSENRNWNDAASMVITGQAGMQFMGDWAKGEFIAAGWTAEKEYGCVLGPGTKAFLMGGDIFVFPKTEDTAEQEAQKKLASLMLSPEVQVAFNNKKGSVPVRPDVDTSKMDACAQEGVAVLKDESLQIPNDNMLISADLDGALNDVAAEFWANPDATADDYVESFASAFEQAG